MEPVQTHAVNPDVAFDGGTMDCGNGLLLLIRRHIDPLPPGGLLEIRSQEPSVIVDLPAWCRMTGNPLLSWVRGDGEASFLVQKGGAESASSVSAMTAPSDKATTKALMPHSRMDPAIPALAVLGIGSWPRPAWLLPAIKDRLQRRMTEEAFDEMATDAVQLIVDAQKTAGVDVFTDGEQRRDSYASFVGHLLEGAELVPLSDLTAMVEDPEDFARELRALDVPAAEVRHPVAFERLRRSRPLVLSEATTLAALCEGPRKLSLPGPYLLTRTMWLECLREPAYATREALAADLVRILREELADLLQAGVAMVQFDEPVLTEVVFTPPKTKRSFMCGALSGKGDPTYELGFALDLLRQVTAGFPPERLAVHLCRGNWTNDESALLTGDYRPLSVYLRSAPVGTLFLELSTPRAGEFDDLLQLGLEQRIGLGLVNPRQAAMEEAGLLDDRLRRARRVFGTGRMLLNPDCGFATFADNPVASRAIAIEKLRTLKAARDRLRED